VIRQTLVLLACLLAITCLRADDPPSGQTEPPVRLKKKAKPQSPASEPKKTPAPQNDPKRPGDPKKKEEAKDEPDVTAAELEEKIDEIRNRLSRNLHEAEERLHKKDPGEKTQLVQRDIVKDLDELIDQTKRQQQQQQQSSSSSSQSQSQRQRMRARQRQQSTSQSQEVASQPQNQPGTGARGGNSNADKMSRLSDVYKDIWGHLPETLRQEMEQYSREQFMAKYNDLLKQYYATIAEKGRRKQE
jgi:hypothetical protein